MPGLCYNQGMTTLKFTKVDRGWYATEDGKWAVVADGYAPSVHAGADAGYDRHDPGTHNLYEGYVGGEWAVVYDAHGNLRAAHNDGENLDWLPTKREAVAAANARAARKAQGAAS